MSNQERANKMYQMLWDMLGIHRRTNIDAFATIYFRLFGVLGNFEKIHKVRGKLS